MPASVILSPHRCPGRGGRGPLPLRPALRGGVGGSLLIGSQLDAAAGTWPGRRHAGQRLGVIGHQLHLAEPQRDIAANDLVGIGDAAKAVGDRAELDVLDPRVDRRAAAWAAREPSSSRAGAPASAAAPNCRRVNGDAVLAAAWPCAFLLLPEPVRPPARSRSSGNPRSASAAPARCPADRRPRRCASAPASRAR